MEIVLLFLALGFLGVTAFVVFGRAFSAHQAGLEEPVGSLPPVILPPRPRAQDVSQMRFSLGFRGYRCDQVDEALEVLSGEIERLNAELEGRPSSVISTTTRNPG